MCELLVVIEDAFGGLPRHGGRKQKAMPIQPVDRDRVSKNLDARKVV
jgi:hypothetical protein